MAKEKEILNFRMSTEQASKAEKKKVTRTVPLDRYVNDEGIEVYILSDDTISLRALYESGYKYDASVDVKLTSTFADILRTSTMEVTNE